MGLSGFSGRGVRIGYLACGEPAAAGRARASRDRRIRCAETADEPIGMGTGCTARRNAGCARRGRPPRGVLQPMARRPRHHQRPQVTLDFVHGLSLDSDSARPGRRDSGSRGFPPARDRNGLVRGRRAGAVLMRGASAAVFAFSSAGALALLSLAARAEPPAANRSVQLGAAGFRVIEQKSGPVNYYRVMNDGRMTFIRAEYRVPLETTVLGFQVADANRARANKLAWSWRARTLPRGGDECSEGKGDSAAVVYVTWKRGLRWYTLKYVWSSVGARGKICDRKRNPFVAQDTIIVESGGPLGVWKRHEIDLRAEFRRHFEDGDPEARVPDFGGVAIMSDGDQTRSESAADYANFVLSVDAD